MKLSALLSDGDWASLRVRDLIPMMVTKCELPVTGPDGTPFSYSLRFLKGDIWRDDQTMKDLGVTPNDYLLIESTKGPKPSVKDWSPRHSEAGRPIEILWEKVGGAPAQ